MKTSKSVWKYGQRVKALIQKLTTKIASSVQVEWYVTGFLKEIGFQIRQARPTIFRKAMEAAQNYKNSAQSLLKSLKRSEKKGVKQYRKEIRQRKHSKSNNSSSSSEFDTTTSNSENSESNPGTRLKHRNRGHSNFHNKKGKGIAKVKNEEDVLLRICCPKHQKSNQNLLLTSVVLVTLSWSKSDRNVLYNSVDLVIYLKNS